MPAAKVQNVETIELRNINGNSDGSVESAVVTFGDLKAGQYVEVGGIKVLATADITASDVASAAAGDTVTDATVSGTLDTDYDDGGDASKPTAGPNNDQVTFTAESVGNLADLTLSGNALTDQPQTNVLTVATKAADGTSNDDFQITLNVNGTTVSTNVVADDASEAVQAGAIADALNAFVGSKVATFADQGNATDATVQVVSDEALNISNFGTKTTTGDAADTEIAVTNAAGGSKYTMDISSGTAAAQGEKVEFYLNGEEVVSEAVTANTDAATATAIVEAINTAYGAVIASKDGSDDITVDTGGVGIALSGFEGDGGTYGDATLVNATAGSGRFSTDAPTISVTDGEDATTDGFEDTLDASNFTDATTFVSKVSTSDVKFTNLTGEQTVEITGNGTLTNGNTTLTYDAEATKMGIDVADGVTAGDITVDTAAAATSASLASTGEANTVGTVDLAGAKNVTVDAATDLTATGIATTGTKGTLTINGAGEVKLGTLDAGFDAVEANDNTGGVALTTDDTNNDVVISLGSGEDTVTTQADGFASTDKFSVNAGEGEDTLVVASSDDIDTSEEGDRYTNFERLSVSNTQDVSLVSGIESIIATGGAIDLTGLNATNAGDITVNDDDGDDTVTDLKVALTTATGTSDATTIAAESDTATQNVSLADLDVDNFETVNLEMNTGTSGTQSVVDFEADKADEVTALNITGSADTKLVVDADVMDVNAVVIDASALSGKFEITDNSGSLKTGSSVIGTDQDDTIEVDDNTGVSYSAGAGDDGFSAVAATLAATGNDDTSLDGGAGEDTLTVSDTAATLTDNNFVNVSNMEKLVLSGTDDHSVTVGANFASAFGSEATITAKDMTQDDHDFAYAGGLYNGDVTIDVEAATVGDSAGEDFSVTTGDGADVVNLALGSFVGAATGGKITVDTDKGNDDITVSIGTIADDAANQTITINAGEGADTVELTKVNGDSGDGSHKSNALFVVDEGDSTLSARDEVTGFDKATAGDSSDVLDFTGTSVATDFTSSVDSGVIKSHSVTNGVVTFDDVDTFDTALTIDDSNLDDVLGYLAENTAKLDTAAFGFDSTGDGSADATMVYNNNDTDSLVELVGVTGVGSLITDTASTADALSIA